MKCLLIGGGGFLGSNLCDSLLAQGFSVKVFERPNLLQYRCFSSDENIEWVEGDFLNPDDISKAIKDCDIIYHFASTTIPESSNENPVYDIETNLIATVKLADLAIKNGIKKIIFPSSGGTVYGIPEVIPIKESHPSNPLCSYGITKLAIEKYFQLYHILYGLDYCILRIANPYGMRQRVTGAQGAVCVFLYKALKGSTIEIWGDGNVVRDYIYVSDVVDALVKAITYDGGDRIFNIGSGKGHSLNDILIDIEKLIDRPVKRIYKQRRPLDVPINILDIEKACKLLQWQPKNSFSQGLEKTLHWIKMKEEA